MFKIMISFIIGLFSSETLWAAPMPPVLKSQKELHDQVNAYLQGITAIVGSFTQTNPDKQAVQGYFWLKRPLGKTGLMRIDYKNGQRIYGNDKYVVIYDLLNHTKTEPIAAEDTPAAFLFSKRMDLKQFMPRYFLKKGQLHAFLQTPHAEITLFFSLYPQTHNIKSLIGWHILDGQGNVTVVMFDQQAIRINDMRLVKDELFIQGVN